MKNKIKNWIKGIFTRISKKDNKLPTERLSFEKLTPVTDSKLGVYEEALNFVFKHDDIRNIALSGAYGAGKSSILESYKKKYPNKKYIHISLAHFSEEIDYNEKDSVKESILEGKILNQLIHQIPTNKIPQTNFKVKKKISRWKSFFTALLLLFSFIAFLFIVFFNKWDNFVNKINIVEIKNVLEYTCKPEVILLIGSILFIFFVYFLFILIQIQKNQHIFHKLSVQGNEIEIFEKGDESYFDKYLNEVLYLFEKAKANVVVFEDMDRFEITQIFARLREINTLINLNKHKEKIIRFFYLLKDDIFASKDRTKFFDFIVPIVPVVDGSNSYDQFISHLQKNGLLQKFDEGFLQGMSLYVDDMRLLKNICNEFIIYYNQLNTTELDCNKMLAIITYKNLFPKDYSDLQLNKGFVYALFQNKNNFIMKEQEKLKIKEKEVNDGIKKINDEKIESLKELENIVNSFNYYIYNHGGEWYTNWIHNVYPQRKTILEKKNVDNLKIINQELESLRIKLQYLELLQLKEIINRENIDEIFSLETENEIGEKENYNEIKSNNYFHLLKYLIRNGYIDETYADYMTYFYGNSLSREDKIFLRSVSDKKAKDYSYQLKEPNIVYERLKPADFDQVETLNYSLVDYMVQNDNQESEKIKHFIAQLKNTKAYTFIENYLEVSKDIPNFIKVLGKQWPEFFFEIYSSTIMNSEHIRKLTINILYYLEDKTLLDVNIKDELSNYISSSKEYLNIYAPKIERLINGFELLTVRFISIDYQKANKDLYKAVYENGNYEVNYQNIKQILTVIFNIKNEDDIRHKTSTLILSTPNSSLAKKILCNINTYIDIIISECENTISDDLNIVLQILNNASLENNQAIAYIEKLETNISNLSSVQKNYLWPMLIKRGIVDFSAQNIIEYYICSKKLDEYIINWINKSYKSNQTIKLVFSESDVSQNIQGKIFDEIIKCKDLDNNAYIDIIVALNRHYDKFLVDDIPTDKIQLLIENNIITMNYDSLIFIRKKYPDSVNFYIEHNIDGYVKIIDNNLFAVDELKNVLSMNVDDEYKLSLLKWAKLPISIQKEEYSDKIKEYILSHNLSKDDLPYLCSSYSQLKTELQKEIINNGTTYISYIKNNLDTTDEILIDDLMKSTIINQENKNSLLLSILPNLDKDKASVYLSLVGNNDFVDIFNSDTDILFPNTSINKNILNIFIEKKWIKGYKIENKSIRINK